MAPRAKCYAYLYGTALVLEKEFPDHIILRPIKLESNIQRLVARTASQREYGFVCALVEAVTFEVEITAESPKEAAIVGWNEQWLFAILSIYTRSPLYHPLNAFRRNRKYKNFPIRVGNLFLSSRTFTQPVSVSVSILKECAAD